MSKRVFISYRRDDAKWQARELYRALIQVLPREQVFMDIDSIPPGADFVDVLEGWVTQCDILLALIGSNWTEVVDPKTGRRRLENPQDFVRIEVRKGLERNIPVVPVLLDGAPIPDAERLPDDLKKLVRRNAEFVEHRTVDTDVERLIKKLGLAQGPVTPPRSPSEEDRHRAEGRIKVDAKVVHGAPESWFKPGNGKTEWFKDHVHGPEMVVVPAGSFMMGSPSSEVRWSGYDGREEPQHKVTIAKPFAVGRHAITRGNFTTFVDAAGHKIEGGAYVRNDKYRSPEGYLMEDPVWAYDPKASWRNPRFIQDDSHSVVCINWWDANAFVTWLTKESGKIYRLLSEAEQEYAMRAGTTTPFWWGSSISVSKANYDGNYSYGGTDQMYGGSDQKDTNRGKTVPVDNFEPNPWGLYQVHGNVWEWTEDCWHDTYNGAPTDGSAWTKACTNGSRRVVRGGSWCDAPVNLRSAYRREYTSSQRFDYFGFRVGRTLTP